ncbi:AmmeMemoRadiSam system protein B [bacterium]|nr:AmmeMemoRadiSam system protein B [bacterium]
MDKEEIRQPAVAGTWYPGNRQKLESLISGYFSKTAKSDLKRRVMGLISPHAGYLYSGQTAAYAYRQIIGYDFKTVVIIAPMHRTAVSRYMTNAEKYYKTPLGLVPVDHQILDNIRKEVNLAYISGDDEHSLEIQLPFLQHAIKDFSIVPILIGHSDVNNVKDIADALAGILDRDSTLIVASSDMHHIDDYRQVEENDNRFIEALKSFDIEKTREILNRRDCTICGKVPISILLETTLRWGAEKVSILNHTNSSEITGRKIIGEYTVGYLAAAVTDR